jgi:hypothetical protein
MKRIAFVKEDGVARKIRVFERKTGCEVMYKWGIPQRNWRFITEREWNSPKYRNDEDVGEITESTLY